MEIDWFSTYDRQEQMLALILEYDKLCRDAIKKGADVKELFVIPSREGIGRAKSVPEESYGENYAALRQQMEAEIEAVIQKGDGQV